MVSAERAQAKMLLRDIVREWSVSLASIPTSDPGRTAALRAAIDGIFAEVRKRPNLYTALADPMVRGVCSDELHRLLRDVAPVSPTQADAPEPSEQAR